MLDYLEAWAERIEANGGLCPDNVGPNGVIGETMDGKWWGGYYGWRWPHGLHTIIEPLTIAAMNAVLLTGDMGYLDIPRGQIDYLSQPGPRGRRPAPRPLSPHATTAGPPIARWSRSTSHRSGTCRRATRTARPSNIPAGADPWLDVAPGSAKGDNLHFGPWYCYLDGRNPDYPRLILESQYAEVLRRMDKMRNDYGDPQEWDVHHWQDINPVHTEALIQLTCGGPQIIYHGGLLHVRLRYFDAAARRPGLPPDVGALVTELDADSVTVQLTNSSPLHERRVILQAGAFGEHHFTDVDVL